VTNIFRAPNPDYGVTLIQHGCIDDTTLSNAELGLLVRLLRLEPWQSTNVAALAREWADGEHRIRTQLRALQDRGYVARVRFRREDGAWQTATFVGAAPGHAAAAVREWEERRAAVTGMQPIPGIDVSAGQDHSTKPPVAPTSDDVTDADVSAGQSQERLSTVGNPPWMNHGGSPHDSSTSWEEPSMGRGRVDALVDMVMDGLPAMDPSPDRAGVAKACRELDPAWTPEALHRWVRAQNWTGSGPGAVVSKLRGAGRPPKPVAPLRDTCPEHPGEPAGRCDQCARRTVPAPASFRASARPPGRLPAAGRRPRDSSPAADAAGPAEARTRRPA
jgi:hypothetical protein